MKTNVHTDIPWDVRESSFAASLRGLRTALLAVVVSLVVFSPAWQMWDFSMEGSYETTRASTFLKQCEDPFRADVEPAMRWRLLPPLLCNALGLSGWSALTVPWIGVVAMLAYCSRILERSSLDRRRAVIGTVLCATTSAVLVPLEWLGMNDAWVWLCLLGVAFGRSARTPLLACVLGPWIDERLVIGLPLALWVRSRQGLGWRHIGLYVLPYLAVRIGALALRTDSSSEQFLSRHLTGFLTWAPFAGLGWFMALRLGWLPIGMAATELWDTDRQSLVVGAGITAATLAVSLALAADISRSAAIVLPLLVWCWPTWAAKVELKKLYLFLAVQLFLPALHVVYTKVAVISPLYVELFRLVRKIY